MKRPVPRILIASLCVALSATACHALPPLGRAIHLHPNSTGDSRIRFNLYNTSMSVRDFEIDGKIYRLGGHQALTIQAVPGTQVLAGDTAPGIRNGEVLFVVRPILQDKTRFLY